MNDTHRILTWIQDVPEQAEQVLLASSRKRKVASDHQLASPSTSLDEANNTMSSSSPKKRRLEEDRSALFDPEATPRPGARTLAASSASRSQSQSSVSGASSPKKQMMTLRLSDTGVEFEPLNEKTVPEAAKALFSAIDDIGAGHDILPDAMRATIIQKLKDRDMDQRRWRHCFRPADEGDALPGRIPSFEEAEKVLSKALECETFKHEEASWNGQVHLRLLEGIFENLFGGQCDDFNAVSCTSARPHREFKPVWSVTKMIDICVYASLDRNQELRAAMANFGKITPTISVNHTDFQPIQLRPLLLSIETKKPGVEWDRAQLQIGVWHAAQWAFLRWSVGQKLLRQRMEQGLNAPATDEEEEEFNAARLELLLKLGFIPGIIVQGNLWHLVLSTYEDGKKTKLLTMECAFGTTGNLRSIYAIVAGVRELTAWARDVYLPWFKESILD